MDIELKLHFLRCDMEWYYEKYEPFFILGGFFALIFGLMAILG